jgi:PAS domain S-box-containing protein
MYNLIYIFPLRGIYLMKEKQIKSQNSESNKNVLNNKTAAEIIIDNLPFSAWIKDERGYFVGVNKAGADAAGKSKEEIIGKSDFELFPKVEAEFFTASDQTVINNKSKQFFESEFNGTWYEEFKSAILDENGKVIGTTGYQRDITNRKWTEEALRESERSKAVLISNLPGVAYRSLNDENWTMTFLSEGCYDLTGYTPDEILRNKVISFHEIISSEYRDITFN